MKHARRGLHHHLRLTAQVTTVIAAVSLLGCIGLFIWVKWWFVPDRVSTASPAAPVTASQTSPTTYREDVKRIIGRFQFDNAAQAETLSYQIIDLRVPPELLQFQLQLVVALNNAQHGEFTQAQATVQSLRQQYAWFTP